MVHPEANHGPARGLALSTRGSTTRPEPSPTSLRFPARKSAWVAPAVQLVQWLPTGLIRRVAPSDRSSGCPSDRVRLTASWEISTPAVLGRARVLAMNLEKFSYPQVHPQIATLASPTRPQVRPQQL